MIFKAIWYFYEPSSKNLCCCKSKVCWPPPAGTAISINLYFQASVMFMTGSLESMPDKWPIHFCPMQNSHSDLCAGSPRWPDQNYVRSTSSWRLSLLIPSLSFHRSQICIILWRLFFVPSCFLSLLPFIGINRQKLLHS